jgi:hypothetical protein
MMGKMKVEKFDVDESRIKSIGQLGFKKKS